MCQWVKNQHWVRKLKLFLTESPPQIMATEYKIVSTTCFRDCTPLAMSCNANVGKYNGQAYVHVLILIQLVLGAGFSKLLSVQIKLDTSSVQEECRNNFHENIIEDEKDWVNKMWRVLSKPVSSGQAMELRYEQKWGVFWQFSDFGILWLPKPSWKLSWSFKSKFDSEKIFFWLFFLEQWHLPVLHFVKFWS